MARSAAGPGGTNVESGGKPLQDMQGKWPRLKTLRYGLLLAVSVATLSGCVSAVSTDMRADNKAAQENEETVAEGSTDETTTPVVTADAAATTQDTATTANAGQTVAGQAGADVAGMVMQPTTLNAGKASIYSNGAEAATTGNAYATQTSGTNAAADAMGFGSHPFAIGEPVDLANIVVFLASDESRMITGAVIPAEGGLTAY